MRNLKALIPHYGPCGWNVPMTTAQRLRFLAALGMTRCDAGNARLPFAGMKALAGHGSARPRIKYGAGSELVEGHERDERDTPTHVGITSACGEYRGVRAFDFNAKWQ